MAYVPNKYTFHKKCLIEGHYSFEDCLMLAYGALGKTGTFISPTLKQVKRPTKAQKEEMARARRTREILTLYLHRRLRSGRLTAIAIDGATQEYLSILPGFWDTKAGIDSLPIGGIIKIPGNYKIHHPQFVAYDNRTVGINLNESHLLRYGSVAKIDQEKIIQSKKPITKAHKEELEKAYQTHVLTIQGHWSEKDDEKWVKSWLRENAAYAIRAQSLARDLRSKFLPSKYKQIGRPKKSVG